MPPKKPWNRAIFRMYKKQCELQEEAKRLEDEAAQLQAQAAEKLRLAEAKRVAAAQWESLVSGCMDGTITEKISVV